MCGRGLSFCNPTPCPLSPSHIHSFTSVSPPGLAECEIQELAYLVLAACCDDGPAPRGGQGGQQRRQLQGHQQPPPPSQQQQGKLLGVMAGQLEIEAGRAAGMRAVIARHLDGKWGLVEVWAPLNQCGHCGCNYPHRHHGPIRLLLLSSSWVGSIPSLFPHTLPSPPPCTHAGSWVGARRVSLEALVHLLEGARPADWAGAAGGMVAAGGEEAELRAFRAFYRWQRSMAGGLGNTRVHKV